ncbi:MAG: capsule assembly Wzi family protein [Planctomycetes bacterium]|jgi:hypothetical protein|nr:capsule assembly Wzi family protein [Planctomycetota bacterium]
MPTRPSRAPRTGPGLARPPRLARGSLAAAFLSLLLAAPAAGQSSPNVSLDDPVYRFLDHLDTLGLIDSRIQGVRPFVRLEAARLLVEADDLSGVRADRCSSLVRSRLRLFREAFRADISARIEPGGDEGDTYWKPLQSLYARYAYLDGTDLPERDAGRVWNEGSQALVGFATHAVLFDALCFHARPEFRAHPQNWTGDPEDRASVVFLETYGKLSAWNLELEGGLDSMAWGQAFHDTLLLSDDAEPLPLIKLTNPMPAMLPWVFESLGPFRAQLFVSRLMDRRRPVREPWFAGMKLSWKPLPFFEIGAARTFLFAGDGGPDPDVATILLGSENHAGRGAQPDVSDQRAGFDVRLRVPLPYGGASLYAESFGEDESHYFPSKWSWLAGVHLAGFLPARNLWLRAEWAETHETAYAHGTYAPGYAHRLGYPGHDWGNSALGHHVGNHATDVYAEAGIFPLPEAEVALVADWEKRRRNLPDGDPSEEHLQLGVRVSATFRWLGGLTLSLEYRDRTIRNAGYVKGETERDSHVSFLATLQF